MKVKNKILSVSTIATLSFLASQSSADQVFNDEVIIVASLCVGVDCVNGENFNFDTVRLKENNLRIKFQDTSSTSSFPSVDWQLTANDSGNGGQNYFAIDNVDSLQTPFKVASGAKTNALYIADSSYVGLGTSAPSVNLHLKSGNSPALRLEQDGSSGFSAQTWDVAGNETNFFVRDVSNASRIPFKIVPGAPSNSIFVANDGDIGFETSTPDGIFDIAHPADANNHALLVSSMGNLGVNVDNGFLPNGLLDVQTTGGISRLTVASDGDVGIGTSTPSGLFDVQTAGAQTAFSIGSSGNVGVGAIAGASKLIVSDSVSDTTPTLLLENTNIANSHGVMLSLRNNNNSYIEFVNTGDSPLVNKWFLGSRQSGEITLAHSSAREFQLDRNGNLTVSGTVSGGSSVTLKENISHVDGDEILRKIADLDILKWNYINDDDNIKHIGPLSEEFHRLFGLNGSESERISYNDLAGVSLGAIKALFKQNQELKLKIKKLEQQIID